MTMAFRSALADEKQTISKRKAVSQVAALCHRDGPDGIEILLITSSSGRWILPKGWPMDDRSDAHAAKQEAWEEAGVKAGDLDETPIGTYMGTKLFNNGSESPCETSVYAIEVTKTVKVFPEADWRKRKWVALDDVVDAVDDPELSDFLDDLRPAAL